MLQLDHRECPSQVRDESGPRGNNERSPSATVAGVAHSEQSRDRASRALRCQPSAPQFHSARDCGMRCALVEFQHQGLRIATRLFLCHDLMGCITAIQSRLNNFQLRTRLVRCSGSDGDSRPDPGSRASSTRFWDAQSGRRPRHAKPCCPVKGPPASKTRRHLVLMNDSCWSLTKPSICQLSAWRPYGNCWINRRTAGCCSPAPTSWSRSLPARP